LTLSQKSKEKIIYSIEIIRTKDGKYQGTYDNYVDTSDEKLGVLKLLIAEIMEIFQDEITTFNIGSKGVNLAR